MPIYFFLLGLSLAGVANSGSIDGFIQGSPLVLSIFLEVFQFQLYDLEQPVPQLADPLAPTMVRENIEYTIHLIKNIFKITVWTVSTVYFAYKLNRFIKVRKKNIAT